MSVPDEEDEPVPGQDLAAETNVRVVGGSAGWVPAPVPAPSIPVLTPEALVQALQERTDRAEQAGPIGPEPSEPEVLHASTTVAASVDLSEPAAPPAVADVLPVSGEGRLVRTGSRAEWWAPVLSAGVGTVMILAGLLLGAAAAYAYGDPTACLDYAKAHHGASGFGCGAGVRRAAILAPMVGFPAIVVGWLAWVWVPERTGHTRVRQCVGLFVVFVVLGILAIVGLSQAVR